MKQPTKVDKPLNKETKPNLLSTSGRIEAFTSF